MAALPEEAHGEQDVPRRAKGKEHEGEVIAFGDSGNDYEMLKMANYSFAMDNAKPAIKEVADYTISSNDEGGVLEAIDWYFNKEKMFK